MPSEKDATGPIAQIAKRVRLARSRAGLSRRILAERSGVSQRYLAQIEAGEGNVTISVLARVAEALDEPVGYLLADPEMDRDLRGLIDLYRLATPDLRQQVRSILAQPQQSAQKARRICLVGLRGAGKSTLGALVSRSLALPFVELNQVIEDIGGMPVPELMALYGQEGYRKLESDALNRVIDAHQHVMLAVAGGIVSEPATFDRLLVNFHSIWLRTSAEEHMARVRAQGDERPMSGHPHAMRELRSILAMREAAYARAGAQLDTSGCSIEDSAANLEHLIRNAGYLV